MKKFIFLYIVVFTCIAGNLFAQKKQGQELIDSLLQTLPVAQKDTSRVNALYELSSTYESIGEYEKGMKYSNEGALLAQKINFENGLSKCYNTIGTIYSDYGNYDKSLEYYLLSLKIKEKLGDKKGIGISYNNIGIIYDNQGIYDKALENFYASLKLFEACGFKKGLANAYNNIETVK